jgi:nanoRNase/pAp phosphatase (c-di-AMP/oligoRNAs hydrolase)
MENSSEFSAYFQNVPKDFKIYSEFKNENKIREAIAIGSKLKQYQFSLIRKISSNSINAKWNNTNIKIVNSPILQSEIGNFLSTTTTAALIWYKNYQANKTIISLRSKGDLDVSVIAEAFGGGGHRNAAGFTIEIEKNVEEYFTINKK